MRARFPMRCYERSSRSSISNPCALVPATSGRSQKNKKDAAESVALFLFRGDALYSAFQRSRVSRRTILQALGATQPLHVDRDDAVGPVREDARELHVP